MSPVNGHAQKDHVPISGPPPAMLAAGVFQFPVERVKELVAALEVPFDQSQIDWRVMNTTKGQQPARGQVVPYADQRAYTDRLNALFTPAGWTRKYSIHTSANFERSRDQKIAAKVLVTCEVTIFGLGSHSATGEEWADDDNAGTAAEAQAFKRACSCFGLGRYLYHFTGAWVDLDERKRPRSIPRLFGWATPHGWRQGLRPGQEASAVLPETERGGPDAEACPADALQVESEQFRALVGQIEAMAAILGRRLYRGVLKSIARVWNPTEIHEPGVLRRVMEQMRAAERELRRLDAALKRVEPGALAPILRRLQVGSLDQIDSLDSLRKVVLEVEQAREIGC